MKNTLLSLGVASAVAVTAVCPAYAAEPAQESSSLSPGAIAGISLGVLALVGAGSYFAVSQGLIDVTTSDADSYARKLLTETDAHDLTITRTSLEDSFIALTSDKEQP